jgi:hypothetical protein
MEGVEHMGKFLPIQLSSMLPTVSKVSSVERNAA